QAADHAVPALRAPDGGRRSGRAVPAVRQGELTLRLGLATRALAQDKRNIVSDVPPRSKPTERSSNHQRFAATPQRYCFFGVASTRALRTALAPPASTANRSRYSTSAFWRLTAAALTGSTLSMIQTAPLSSRALPSVEVSYCM